MNRKSCGFTRNQSNQIGHSQQQRGDNLQFHGAFFLLRITDEEGEEEDDDEEEDEVVGDRREKASVS